MPRPTAAQLAYGSCTVIFSTLAMLLLSRTTSGLGIVVIALAALALGLLVAMTVPMPKAHTADPVGARQTRAQTRVRARAHREPVTAGVEPVRGPTAS
ncbi:hypothetical protein ACFY2M_07620 [Streptomyces sp. NPDC001276]|uniref:hypothetical protein n=1 Tax=Streptomyces sp. NPDC001276 TaxID=3364555 RepID=UPI00369078F6